MLINLRNALMTGKRLPYDAEVEYLESTGEQYIEVPMVVDNSATVNITGYVGTTNRELYSFDKNFRRQFNIENGATYYRWWTINPMNIGSGYIGSLHSYKCNSSIWVDGVLTGTSTPTDTGSTEALYILNGSHGATNGRVYHVSVEYGGILIFDFIPVRRGTVGYLYDRVSGKLFGNAGSGDFALGPDVVPVEWLESDGNQFITTDFVPNDSSGIYLKSAPMAMADVVHVGCRSTANGRWWVNYGGASNINASWNRYENADAIYASGQVYIIENNYLNSRSFVVDGETKNTSLYSTALGTTTHPAAIFAANNIGSIALKAKCKIYELRFSQGSAIARSFRSVRVGSGSTWEGAMMDVLARRIYRNAGTGAFTYGNDLRYPIPAE